LMLSKSSMTILFLVDSPQEIKQKRQNINFFIMVINKQFKDLKE